MKKDFTPEGYPRSAELVQAAKTLLDERRDVISQMENYVQAGTSSSETFRAIFVDLHEKGKLVSPRGQLVREIENYTYVLPPRVRFQSFESRKFNLSYVKKEFLWYLKGDKFDTSIGEHAKMWNDLVNDDGSINSNYGQYIFSGEKNQFDNVVKELRRDKDSRRASMAILSKEHLLSETKDVPCTYALNFRIRDGKLNMSVAMRSQDAVFGMTNDAPCFSFVHEMVLNALRETYPDLRYGDYFHYANSFHVYERHFGLLDKIVSGDRYIGVDCPEISGFKEATFLRRYAGMSSNDRAREEIPEDYKFTKWLIA